MSGYKKSKYMNNWFTYLKQGFSRKLPGDRIAGDNRYSGINTGFNNLRPFIKRHWREGLLGAFLILLTSLLEFPPPLIYRYLVDNVILNHQTALLAGTIFLLACFLVAEKLLNMWQDFYFARFEQQVTLDIQRELLERTLRFPKRFFDENETGYLMSRLSSDVEELGWFFSGTVVYILSNILRLAGGLVFIFYLEWRLAVGVLFVMPWLFFSTRYFSKKVYILSHHSMEEDANVSTCLQESLSSASLIKTFSSEDHTVHRIISQIKKAFQVAMEQSTISSAANLTISSMPWLARGCVLTLGAYWVIKGQWSLGSLLAFLAYLGYVFGPAQSLAMANLNFQQAMAGLKRVSALFDIVLEENLGTGEKVKRLNGKIEFRNVSFSYNEREPVLEDVSFIIKPGEHVSLVGPSGVGKTTLLSLMLCFYKPVSGKILFDDLPVSDYEVISLRRRIGYVSQSTLLLSGTIMENLCYGNSDATEREVVQAAKSAGIHDFISSLMKGYETKIGEKGVNLSEGQKQRLSIARALIKQPDILVLDEPASSLDSLTERSIFNAIPVIVRDRTLLLVAHRLSTIKDSDRILLFNENRLIATGTHQSLFETNDYYRSLVVYQQIGTETKLSPSI